MGPIDVVGAVGVFGTVLIRFKKLGVAGGVIVRS